MADEGRILTDESLVFVMPCCDGSPALGSSSSKHVVCVCVVPSSPPLQAFLRPGVPLQPGLLPPGTQLSLPDAVRLRDRATILARQLYATPDGAGPAVADQQVGVMWCDVV